MHHGSPNSCFTSPMQYSSITSLTNPFSHQQTTITHLTISPDGQHLAAATDLDKSLHVFRISADQPLSHLSTRPMPKRLSAITFNSCDESILCADKFGDVYAVPIREDPAPSATKDPESTAPGLPSNGDGRAASLPAAKRRKTSKPAATELTVHSQRNLKALEQQKAQMALREKNQPVDEENEDDAGTNERRPILGHVSMLTDVVAAEVTWISVAEENGSSDREFIVPATTKQESETYYSSLNAKYSTQTRNYIFTADRDEHIRVSRGTLAQAHIIEKFCLAHERYVRKALLPRPDVLVSGGGDDYLCAWDWFKGELRCKIDIRKDLSALLDSSKGSGGGDGDAVIEKILGGHIAVSGLWTVPALQPQSRDAQGNAAFGFLVALEGSNLLLCYSSTDKFNRETSTKGPEYIELVLTLHTPANILDVAVLSDADHDPETENQHTRIFISLDPLHAPGTTSTPRDAETTTPPRLTSYTLDDQHFKQTQYADACETLSPTIEIPSDPSERNKALEPLRQMLYPSAGLRKREIGGDEGG